MKKTVAPDLTAAAVAGVRGTVWAVAVVAAAAAAVATLRKDRYRLGNVEWNFDPN